MSFTDFLQQQARIDERRHILQLQLARRFGPLPAVIVARIGQADSEQLLFWLERLVVARSLNEVFAAAANDNRSPTA